MWLQNNTAAVLPVLDKGKLTSRLRVKRLRGSKDSVLTYFNTDRVLKLYDAFALVSQNVLKPVLFYCFSFTVRITHGNKLILDRS